MVLARCVTPELLDELPADDPRAMRSRRDLRLVNRLIGSHSILLHGLDAASASRDPGRLVELGAGDGTAMLRLARARAARWRGVAVVLVDQRPVVAPATLDAIRALGWDVEVVAADVFHWLSRASADGNTVALANLFVHHFDGERLRRLLAGIAEFAPAFVCCEPRRAAVPLAGSHMLGFVGCNDVSRHDAVLSVHAGFRDRELSELWPAGPPSWRLRESAALLFSHSFTAIRTDR